MTVKPLPETSQRPILDDFDLSETRLEAQGYVFHGVITSEETRRGAVKNGMNVLHFARCSKLDQAGADQSYIWFRTIGIAKQHLDAKVGAERWKWCKVCEREITQRLINER